MKNYTFHFEVQDVLKQFADALNDIIVKRYNTDREAGDQIHVNFIYAPKTRTLHELIEKNQHFKLPCISISLGNIQRDTKRVFNKLDGSNWTDTFTSNVSARKWLNLLQPVPVNLSVNVSIIARFQSDIDQILSNFIPYTDPYFTISWKWPDVIPFSDFEIRSIVKWSETVNLQYPTDISKETPYHLIADTSFTINSWIFKNVPPDGKPIYTINHTFASVSAIDTYSVMQNLETEYNTDVIITSARPQSMYIEPLFTYLNTADTSNAKTFTIMGKMLDYTDSVYLSSSNWNLFNYSTTGDFSSAGPGLVDFFTVSSFAASASYPAFSGIPLLSSKWEALDKNNLKFTFTPTTTGVFDVILVNSAGYGILSRDTIRPTLNPYPSSDPEFSSYVEYQYPCISGIQVRGL